MRANKNGVNKDQKDKVKKDGYNRGQHCIYCLMIFVTHYRKPVINDEMSAAMKEFSNHSGTDQTVYLWGRYFILEPQLLYRNYRKCFS